MRLTHLTLEQFRNYEKLEFTFPDENIVLIEGLNAQGKTNFLESIYLLSITRTFRRGETENLIQWGKSHCRIKAKIEKDKNPVTLEYFYTNENRKHKSLKLKERKAKPKEFIGQLKTVFFHSDDINMLVGEPILRRRFLNTLLVQINPYYLEALSTYEHALKQRNNLLKLIKYGEANVKELAFWDRKLSENGMLIISERLKLIEFLNNHVTSHYQTISGEDLIITLTYKSTVKINPKMESYEQELQNSYQIDLKNSATGIGPHRDDFTIELNSKNILGTASRGELRTIALTLKLAEVKFIQEQSKELPILLLDDVFSELDQKRQKYLLNTLNGCQTIVTAIEGTHAPLLENIPKWKIEKGKFT